MGEVREFLSIHLRQLTLMAVDSPPPKFISPPDTGSGPKLRGITQ